ncbi:MAG: hypothetical protein AAF282_06505, partial [Cyanobacteria bacterium P01_A01_bin.15]
MPTASKKLVQVDETNPKKTAAIPSLSKGMFVELLERGSETAELPSPPMNNEERPSFSSSSSARARQQQQATWPD